MAEPNFGKILFLKINEKNLRFEANVNFLESKEILYSMFLLINGNRTIYLKTNRIIFLIRQKRFGP